MCLVNIALYNMLYVISIILNIFQGTVIVYFNIDSIPIPKPMECIYLFVYEIEFLVLRN